VPVKKFRKSVNIWKIYTQSQSGTFLRRSIESEAASKVHSPTIYTAIKIKLQMSVKEILPVNRTKTQTRLFIAGRSSSRCRNLPESVI